MDAATKVLAFLVVLGVLVVFHELGHYWVARWCRVKVLRFSVGFGRVVWSRRFGPDRTEWALSAVPLGGYVKMLDEREGTVPASDLARAFNRQSVWKRIAIVAADGASVRSWQDLRWRLLRASGARDITIEVERPDGARLQRIVALTSLAGADWEGNFMPALGFRTDLGAPLIDEVLPDKPAARAGLRKGDLILAIDGVPVRSPAEVAARTNAKPGAAVTFRIGREGSPRDVTLVTEVAEQAGHKVGIAGIRLKVDPVVADRLAVTVRYGVVEALVQGARKTWELATFTVRMLGRILVGDASLKNISGPITMADFAGQSAQAGTLVFVGYLALISISLGVLNLLPVPLLDGGHLLYYFVEIIKGSPVSDRAFEVGQRIGMAMLAVLMALALFNDLSRLF